MYNLCTKFENRVVFQIIHFMYAKIDIFLQSWKKNTIQRAYKWDFRKKGKVKILNILYISIISELKPIWLYFEKLMMSPFLPVLKLCNLLLQVVGLLVQLLSASHRLLQANLQLPLCLKSLRISRLLFPSYNLVDHFYLMLLFGFGVMEMLQ